MNWLRHHKYKNQSTETKCLNNIQKIRILKVIDPLSGLRQFLIIENPLKVNVKSFFFS